MSISSSQSEARGRLRGAAPAVAAVRRQQGRFGFAVQIRHGGEKVFKPAFLMSEENLFFIFVNQFGVDQTGGDDETQVLSHSPSALWRKVSGAAAMPWLSAGRRVRAFAQREAPRPELGNERASGDEAELENGRLLITGRR